MIYGIIDFSTNWRSFMEEGVSSVLINKELTSWIYVYKAVGYPYPLQLIGLR